MTTSTKDTDFLCQVTSCQAMPWNGIARDAVRVDSRCGSAASPYRCSFIYVYALSRRLSCVHTLCLSLRGIFLYMYVYMYIICTSLYTYTYTYRKSDGMIFAQCKSNVVMEVERTVQVHWSDSAHLPSSLHSIWI